MDLNLRSTSSNFNNIRIIQIKTFIYILLKISGNTQSTYFGFYLTDIRTGTGCISTERNLFK